LLLDQLSQLFLIQTVDVLRLKQRDLLLNWLLVVFA